MTNITKVVAIFTALMFLIAGAPLTVSADITEHAPQGRVKGYKTIPQAEQPDPAAKPRLEILPQPDKQPEVRKPPKKEIVAEPEKPPVLVPRPKDPIFEVGKPAPATVPKESSADRGWFSRHKWKLLGLAVLVAGGIAAAAAGGGDDDGGKDKGSATISWSY